MPRYDSCHETVANALRREGWQVEDAYRQTRDKRYVYIDLRASQGDQKTFIEVKCFPNLADPDEQYTAVGQYLIYQTFLKLQEIDDLLYLAVPVIIYENHFDDVMIETLRTHHISLLIFDESGERGLQWKRW